MSDLNELRPIQALSPFKRFCCTIGNLPSSYVESMSYMELVYWLCDYLQKTVVPSINNNAYAIQELQNYFSNLDVQDEINNKLDEMAENGELTEIIAQYLQLAGLLCFNTLNDMKNATNIVDGSFAKTYGSISYNDGLGAFYKIRKITNADVVDNINIISINSDNTLVAELIPDNNILSLQQQINTIDNNTLSELIVVGDSYTALSTSNWAELVASQLHLNLHKHGTSSMGFVHSVNGKTFIDNLSWGESLQIKNKTKYVICYGGINDKNENLQTLYTNVKAFCEEAKLLYPNAQIIIVGPQAPASNFNGFTDLINTIEKASRESGVSYANAFDWLAINNFSYSLTYDNDLIHPSSLGYKIIASKMLSLLLGNPINNNLIKFTNYNNLDGNIKVCNNNGLCSLNYYINSISLEPNAFTTILECSIPFKEFMPGNQYFPVFAFNTEYSYATELIGWASFNSDFSKMRVVNIKNSTYTGAICFRADIMTCGTN